MKKEKASMTDMPSKNGAVKVKKANKKAVIGKVPAMKKGGSMNKKGC